MTQPTNSLSACAGCGGEITQNGRGRPRKWCSDRCRMRSCYTGTCMDCGAPTYSGWAIPPERCIPCSNARVQAERHALNTATIEAMWADGMTLREIASAMGWKNPKVAGVVIARLRSEGADLPHRRDPETVAHLQRIGARNLVKARAVKAAA